MGAITTDMITGGMMEHAQSQVTHNLNVANTLYANELRKVESAANFVSNCECTKECLRSRDYSGLQNHLQSMMKSEKLSILTIADHQGKVLARGTTNIRGDDISDDPLIRKALEGKPTSSTEVFQKSDLAPEGLDKKALIMLVPTEGAESTNKTAETSGMMLVSVDPIYDNGNIIGVVQAAKLLNHDYSIVDEIKNTVGGSATIFCGDVRISTTITENGKRAVGTRVSKTVNDYVIKGGKTYYGRAFVVNDWYITAYTPIKNSEGKIIGMLYVGIKEAPFIALQRNVATQTVIIWIFSMILALGLAWFMAHKIIQPIYELTQGAKNIGAGDLDHKINIKTKDELEELADAFNQMTNDLKKIKKDLEDKLAELTALHEFSDDIGIWVNETHIFKSIAKKVIEGLGFDKCAIFMLDNKENAIEGRFLVDGTKNKNIDHIKFPINSDKIPAIALRKNKPIHVRNASADPGYDSKHGEFVQIPIRIGKIGERAIGVLAVDNHKSKNPISYRQIKSLITFANTAGLALERIRTYKILQDKAAELEDAYEELKKMDKLKSEFISNISHELRTPLTSIKGYASLILDEKMGNLNDKIRDSLDIIDRNVDRLTDLIDDMLDLTRMETGKINYKMERIQLDEVVRNSVEDLRLSASKKGLEITYKLPEYPLNITGDKGRLTQVMTNLLENAIKFTPSGGKIHIEVEDRDKDIHVKVTDTGIGIPDDKLSEIFTKFYQVDSSTTRKTGGTGLGLYMVRNIIAAHNGKIWVESKLGEGSKFHFILPYTP